MFLPQLKRIRWAVRMTLILGVLASMAANILHARHELVSQIISAWPPVALLLTVELTSRIPMHKRSLAAVRVLATVAIAGIAAWVSYWHMQGVAVTFGETETSAYLLPISVDGLIVVASVSLVELAGRIRLLEERKLTAATAAVAPVQFLAPQPPAAPVFQAPPAAAPVSPAPAPAPARVGALREDTSERPTYISPSVAEELARVAHATPVSRDGVATASPRVPTSPVSGRPLAGFGEAPSSAPASPVYVNGSAPGRPSVTRAAVSAPARTMVTANTELASDTTPRPRRPVQETAELADAIEARQPGITLDEIAEEIGISPARLRQVRREAAALR